MAHDLTALRQLKGKVAIVGVGETDYHKDYVAQRTNAPNYQALDSDGLAALAFTRALADSGLKREDIDGFAVSMVDQEATGNFLGIKGNYSDSGFSWDLVQKGARAVATGQCNTLALIFGNAQRTSAFAFGGASVNAGPLTYRYYHPWGWSGQPAHWAMMFKSYQLKYGCTEEQLGAVAVTFRENAALNGNAVMQKRITLDDYLSSRFIVRPLRLLDLCLVNDGGVCIILQRTDMARERPKVPVLVEGFGVHAGGARSLQLADLIEDHLRDFLGAVRDQALDMADLKLRDIDMLHTYDAGSPMVPIHLEGLGFCKPGEGAAFIQDGRIGLKGQLPMNTDGGQLSASYVQGWSQVAEIVRQLRGEAGPRQVADAQTALFCVAGGIGAHATIFRRDPH